MPVKKRAYQFWMCKEPDCKQYNQERAGDSKDAKEHTRTYNHDTESHYTVIHYYHKKQK